MCGNSHARERGTNSMHFLHMMEPQSRQWWRRFLMLNLSPQSGQNGTSWSFTHGTTDFSIAAQIKQPMFWLEQMSIAAVTMYSFSSCSSPTSYLPTIHIGSIKGNKLEKDKKEMTTHICLIDKVSNLQRAEHTAPRSSLALRNVFYTSFVMFLD